MASRGASRPAYRDPFRDYPDQTLFFILFVAGAAAIWIIKSSGLSQFVATAVPVGLMLLYAAAAWIAKRYRLREDRVGDNIYYLGFLYTLVSLAYALYTYQPDGSGAADVITNFGIAIFTTIVGLAGRVFFSQMREDPVEYEREARYALAEATNAMRAQLGDISSEASIFKRKIGQVIDEGITEATRLACSFLDDNVARCGDTSAAVLRKIDDAFTQFSEHSVRLNNMAARSITAMERLIARVEQIEISPQVLSEKFNPVLAAFEEAAAEIARRNRVQDNGLQRVTAVIEASESSMKELHDRIATSHRSLSSMLEDTAGQLHKTAAAAAALTQSLDATHRLIDGKDLAAGGLGELLRRETLTATEAFESLHRTLESGREAGQRALSELEDDLVLARRHRADAARMLEESKQAYQELEQSLVSLTRTMIEQLSVR